MFAELYSPTKKLLFVRHLSQYHSHFYIISDSVIYILYNHRRAPLVQEKTAERYFNHSSE